MHGHAHSHAELPDIASPAVAKMLTVVVAAAAALALVGMLVLWPGRGASVLPEDLGFAEQVDGKVVSSRLERCSFSSSDTPEQCHASTVVVTGGPTKGDTTRLETPVEGGTLELEAGDQIVLNYIPEAPSGSQYQFADFQRRNPLLLLALVFAVAVVLLGRLRGLLALAGLAVSFAVLAWFVLPALLAGSNPLLIALIGATLIAVSALYLAHGTNERTSVAVLGTLASLVLTGALALVFVAVCNFTGLAQEDAGYLRVFAGALDFRGLLLAGIIIGSLGVLDDVTVTQVSAVWELRQADPAMPAATLYRAALRIGRDHIASTVNTLVLAYAGASLPLLLLVTETERPLGNVIGSETVAVEIVRTLVGSIGLVASVPITTALAVFVVAGRLRDGLGHLPLTANPPLRSKRRKPGRPSLSAEADALAEADETGESTADPARWEDFAPIDDREL